MQDMTSLAVSGRLQNVIKYCTEVRKTVCPATKSTTIQPRINQICMDSHANID